MRRHAIGAGLVVLSLAAAACSAGRTQDQADPPARSPSVSPTASGAPTNAPPAPSVEQVLVTHATVPQLHLSRPLARSLRRGTVRTWDELDRPGERLRVVRTIAEVEKDPSAVGLVPIDTVGPAVNVARVAGADPIRDAPQAVSVTLVGDVMLTRGVEGPEVALAPMSGLLSRSDLTVANLESTLSTNGSPTQGGDSFGGSPALLGPLNRAGFDALSLANNHAGDYGEQALVETVRRMRESPIVPFGAGSDLAAASRPAILEAGGVRFAFVGFNAIGETPRAQTGQPGALSVRMPPRTGPLQDADLRHVERVLRRADRRADVVIALPHWGTQYTHRPDPIQRTVAKRLVASGADLVVGGHPHWVQGIDRIGGVPVIHSIGNFVFDMDFMEETMEGVVLETVWWGEELKAIRPVAYRMDPTTFAPRVLRGDAAAGVLSDLWSTSTGPYRP